MRSSVLIVFYFFTYYTTMQESHIRNLYEAHKKIHWENSLEYPSFRARIYKWWESKRAVESARTFERKQTVWKEKVKVANHCNTEHPSFNTEFMWKFFKVSKEVMNSKTIRFGKNLFYSEKEVQKLLNDVNDKQSYDKQTIISEFLSEILNDKANEIIIWIDGWNKITYILAESVDKIMSKLKDTVIDNYSKNISEEKPDFLFFSDPNVSGEKPIAYWSEIEVRRYEKEIKSKYDLSIWRRFAISMLAAITVLVLSSVVVPYIIFLMK